MQNQPVVGIALIGTRHKALKTLFDLHYRFSRSDFRAIRDTKDVGVDSNRFPAKCGIEHYISGLSANTRKRLECLTMFGHRAAVMGE